MARLKELYNKELKKKLSEKLSYKNEFQIPKITKVVLNIGVGENALDSKKINSAVEDLTMISGQSVGIKEQIIFPEIDYDKIDKVRGMDVSIVTSANTDKEALELLKGFNFPFN